MSHQNNVSYSKIILLFKKNEAPFPLDLLKISNKRFSSNRIFWVLNDSHYFECESLRQDKTETTKKINLLLELGLNFFKYANHHTKKSVQIILLTPQSIKQINEFFFILT